MTDERLFKIVLDDMVSPFQKFKFKVGEKYVCDDFDPNPENECSRGFYATGIEGLTYSYRPGRRIFEVAVGGKNVNVDPIFKRRWEYMELVREVFQDEIIDLAKAHEPVCGYLLSEAIYPANPLLLPPPQITDNIIMLLKKWICVRASVRASVRDSVMDSVSPSVWASVMGSVMDCVRPSVRDSVMDSVMGSVRACVRACVRPSVWDSMWSYFGALFPRVKKWWYVDHEPGSYPYQYGSDLWRLGLVPSYDGKKWRLHSGKNAEIVWEEK